MLIFLEFHDSLCQYVQEFFKIRFLWSWFYKSSMHTFYLERKALLLKDHSQLEHTIANSLCTTFLYLLCSHASLKSIHHNG